MPRSDPGRRYVNTTFRPPGEDETILAWEELAMDRALAKLKAVQGPLSSPLLSKHGIKRVAKTMTASVAVKKVHWDAPPGFYPSLPLPLAREGRRGGSSSSPLRR